MVPALHAPALHVSILQAYDSHFHALPHHMFMLRMFQFYVLLLRKRMLCILLYLRLAFVLLYAAIFL